ncbi:MAG TPA: transglycosylase SLT domain-containing protein, partial [Anaerolineae bacterium]
AMGLEKQGYQRMRDITEQYPNLPTAVVAMQELDKAGRSIDDLQRGIIYYHADENVAAQQAFRRAISTNKQLNEVRYWAALNYAAMGSNIDAYRNLNQIIAEGPGATRYGDAMVEKGNLLQSAGDEENAISVYRQFTTQAPSDAQAPEAMGQIALLYERYGQLELAADAYKAASNAYSQNPNVAEYMLRSAVMSYRLGRYPESMELLRTTMARYPTGVEHDLAQLWLGKGQLAAGNIVTGQETLKQLAARVPDTYEGTRAAEIAFDRNRVPLSKPFGKPLTPTVESSARAQLAAEDWLRAQANISSTVDIRTISPTIMANPHLTRGTDLWRLGFTEDATDEFDGLRDDLGNNPIGMYQVALYLRDLGAYRESISTGAALLRSVNATNVSDAPAFLGQLVYPLYFADLIFAEASNYALDPLLVASLIRQESLFETFAASTASAFGLMQVVPATGKEINTSLGWPQNYNEQDLLRPWVSVRFGTYYLAHQRDALKGDLYATLAAYNGGPGMAMRWRERSGGDPDAFFLTVPLDGAGYRETQLYLRTVTTNYAIYHRLYAGD